MRVSGTELAVTKIALDLEGISHVSTAHGLTHFFFWLFKTMLSGNERAKYMSH